MSRIAQSIVWIASLASLAVVAQAAVAETKDHPYQVILTRNAFGLKPVPVVEPAKPDEGPPPNIKLTGLIGITIPKKAMLVVTPAGKGNPLYLTVNEGEYSEDSLLQVVEIDELAGSVKIAMNGKTSVLDFVNNGIKNAVAPAPIPTGVPPVPGTAVQLGSSVQSGKAGSPAIQFNTTRPTDPAGSSQPAASVNALSTIPTRELRGKPK